MVVRCKWAEKDALSMSYHDHEWGVSEFDAHRLFELLTLEIFQAGLSWTTILKKRTAFRTAFANFDFNVVSKYGSHEFEALLNNASIIRNRAKIQATIDNAKAIVRLTNSGMSLVDLTWQPTHYHPLNHFREQAEQLDVSQFLKPYLAQFKQHGFKRLGPTTMYSFLQAAGVINDHQINCYRYKQIVNIKINDC
ncbi:DNA-3-methyladenine glycosylase I [Nicoliella lavandulae]|uniref:DNA-3-methyladenine glycosylase I n=1 Tax=Nicoliella lavandulae TaxID=3082954 RepID=A0ABU8SKE6_9LACO